MIFKKATLGKEVLLKAILLKKSLILLVDSKCFLLGK
ncbi:MAG: hypothetical protein ACI8RP_001647 [Urechidicola sp.]|jgi:hypothetical protein